MHPLRPATHAIIADFVVYLAVVAFLAVGLPLRAQQIEVTHTPIEKLTARAEAGEPEAEFELGSRYYSGKGVIRDFSEAVKWFRRAADQNFAKAQYNLGFCYSKGEGVKKDDGEALKWYRKAADQNLAIAQTKLGFCYARARGVEKDDREAVNWYRKAADQKFPLAQYNLGDCYANGRGVPKDDAEAARWYRLAADQNLPVAQNRMGACYAIGAGVIKDAVEAAKWYRRAADQNFPFAQYNLANCYASGTGVAKNMAEAAIWLRKAAEQKHPKAQTALALCHARGAGVKRNQVEAVKWLQAAISQNYAEAEYLLGLLYTAGDGVVKSMPNAIALFRKAAEQNLPQAQSLLGMMYYNGEGVTKNYIEAYTWLLLSAGQGDQDGKQYVSVVERKMTPEQIAEGQKRAASFRPHTPGSDEESSGNLAQERPKAFGSGFFITDDGFLVTNYHVVADSKQVRISTATGLVSAKVVKVDTANDLALLKAEGKFSPLPVAQSRGVKLGDNVSTIGFPNVELQGLAPKFSRGEVASLSGPVDDARYFQISAAVQPGNSGGALVNDHGNVVGVVSAKLSARMALSVSGALPENVNYAVKSSFLLAFLESIPELASKLREPNTTDTKSSDVVERAKDAAVLVLVY